MALNIKNREVERLAAEVATLAKETKTEAIRRALAERRERLAVQMVEPNDKAKRLRRFLEEEIWPTIPPDVRGKPITKEEREAILGYGPGGV
jgi:antitoxin VapB